VEIKSFLGESEVDDLEKALGQFVLYRAVLAARQPDWLLFLAVPENTIREVFDAPLGRLMVADQSVRIFGFDPHGEVITRWIHETT
jgi:XisH protein